MFSFFFFFNDTATTEIYTLSLHDALPICPWGRDRRRRGRCRRRRPSWYRSSRLSHTPLPTPVVFHYVRPRSEEHTSELQSLAYLVCRLLLEKKKRLRYTSTRTHSLLSAVD